MRGPKITALFEAPTGIELLAAELAAERIEPAELRELHVLQDAIVRDHHAVERKRYLAANCRIHRLIVEAARNACQRRLNSGSPALCVLMVAAIGIELPARHGRAGVRTLLGHTSCVSAS